MSNDNNSNEQIYELCTAKAISYKYFVCWFVYLYSFPAFSVDKYKTMFNFTVVNSIADLPLSLYPVNTCARKNCTLANKLLYYSVKIGTKPPLVSYQ